ncbi:hypothetical protein Tco_0778415, partial [Tanacetum coccineum]
AFMEHTDFKVVRCAVIASPRFTKAVENSTPEVYTEEHEKIRVKLKLSGLYLLMDMEKMAKKYMTKSEEKHVIKADMGRTYLNQSKALIRFVRSVVVFATAVCAARPKAGLRLLLCVESIIRSLGQSYTKVYSINEVNKDEKLTKLKMSSEPLCINEKLESDQKIKNKKPKAHVIERGDDDENKNKGIESKDVLTEAGVIQNEHIVDLKNKNLEPEEIMDFIITLLVKETINLDSYRRTGFSYQTVLLSGKYVVFHVNYVLISAYLQTLSAFLRKSIRKHIIRDASLSSKLFAFAQGWGGKYEGLGLVACATENVSDPVALELGSTLHFKFYAGNESLKENSNEQATKGLQIFHLPEINTYEKTDLELLHKLVEEPKIVDGVSPVANDGTCRIYVPYLLVFLLYFSSV